MFASPAILLASDISLAARNVRRHTKRSLFALIIIAGGVIAFLLAGGFINWILHSMRETTIQSQLGHIQITRPGFRAAGASDPYKYLLTESEIANRIEAEALVRTVAPRLTFGGLVSHGNETIAFIGEGIEPSKEAPITKAIIIVAGRDLTENDTAAVLMGAGLAANLGVVPGDRVVLLGNTAEGSLNAVEVEIAGLFATFMKAYDDSVMRAPIAIARELMRVEGATSWVVLLDDTDHTEGAMGVLASGLDPGKFELTPWWDLADFYRKTVDLFTKQVALVRILIAAIVILSITNTLSMAVAERTGEIGTSMALGVKRRRILMLFLFEGGILGISGGVIGVGLAVALGALISHVGIPMPPPPGMDKGYIGQILISPSLGIDGFLLAFVTTLIASVFPARRAARLNVVDALRQQR